MELISSTEDVLIPLNSGLVFTAVRTVGAINRACLNPFEFRAGIYWRERLAEYQKKKVLIPLNSGLVFTGTRSCKPLGCRRS